MAYYFDSPLDKELSVTINTDLNYQCMYKHEIEGETTFTIPSGTVGFYAFNTGNPIYYHSKSSSSGGDLCYTDPSCFAIAVEVSDTRYSFSSQFGTTSGNFLKRTAN